MKLESVRLGRPVEVAGYVVQAAHVGQRVATWRDGPVVESITVDGTLVTIRLGELEVVVHGDWSGVVHPQAARSGVVHPQAARVTYGDVTPLTATKAKKRRR